MSFFGKIILHVKIQSTELFLKYWKIVACHYICCPFKLKLNRHPPNAEPIQHHNHNSFQQPISFHGTLLPMVNFLIIKRWGCVAEYKKWDDNGKKLSKNVSLRSSYIHMGLQMILSNTTMAPVEEGLQCERTKFDCKINDNFTNVLPCLTQK